MVPVLAALFFGFVPCFIFAAILYWLDRYEKEPKLLLGAVFAWGAIVAAGGSYIINSVFGMTIFGLTGSEGLADVTGATISAPLVEESLKGLAVLIVFLIFRHEFDSVLDGIVYAGISALGFAAVENSIYIWRGYLSDGWGGMALLVFIRVILVGWQHPFYTAFIGIGLAVARTSRNGLVKFAAPLLGWGLAMFTHAMHNFLASVPLLGELTCLLGSALDWLGVIFMFVIILWAGWMEHKNIILHMREEVQAGIISPAQYRTASSNLSLAGAWLGSIFNGSFSSTTRFYQVVGELAHKKEQLRKHGEESGNSVLVQKYRQELATLSPRANS
jgi:protease PrsW